MPEIPEGIHRCRLLVDGYNLMFDQGWGPARHSDHKALQRGRELLITRLADRIPVDLRAAVWIVFDALDAPKHLASRLVMQGMNVVFSRDWLSADEMIQQILSLHSSPKAMMVISSDHAVQRKANARSARFSDSDRWEEAIALAFPMDSPQHDGPGKASEDKSSEHRDRPISHDERDEWLKRFGF
jgi:predicted RNA-binding protein with PIN domain